MDDLLATLSQATGAKIQQPAQSAGLGAFDPTKSYGTPPQMLDNLSNQESSGGKNLVNPTTGAMGPNQFTPSTLASLRQQGVKFDPFDPQQSRAAADWYIQKLRSQNGGSYDAALKAYGGFVHADPTTYIDHVKNGVPGFQGAPAPTTPGQSYSGQQASGYSGPTSDLMDTLQSAVSAPAQAPKASTQPQGAPQPQAQPESSFLGGLGHAAAGLADSVLAVPGQAVQAVDYAARRALQQTPQQAEQASQNDFGGSQHLIGNALGITNTAGYQGEASQKLSQLAGNVMGKGAQAVSSATGGAVSPQDAGNMLSSLAMLAPGAIKGAAPIARDAALATAADDASVRAAPPAAPSGPAMQPRTVVGGGAASTNLNPYPVLSGEDATRGPFPQVKLSRMAEDATPAEQAVRAGIVNQVMPDAGSVRTGVITGNENALRDEYGAAKSPVQTPATQAMKSQIANEQQALADYGQQRVDATGASSTLLNDEQRGRAINDAIYGPEDSLVSYFRDAKNSVYEQARQTEGDNPIGTANITRLLNDPQFAARVTGRGNQNVVRAANQFMDLARDGGLEDPVSGQMYQPNSVASLDTIRKALNGMWNESNQQTVAELNAALDRDMASGEGNDLYKRGDQIHQAEKTILGTAGIGTILGDYDANGVKVGTALENIPDKLNSMPTDRWQHLRNVLDDLSRGQIHGAPDGMPPVPDEVMQAAGQARNEMDGAAARAVLEAGTTKAGVWNQNAVNKVLNSTVGQKIISNFSPEEVQAFHTLNYAGQIMPGVHPYEGAGNQLSRLTKPGFVERFAPNAGASTGAAIGSHIPIPGAGWFGAAAGERVGSKISDLAQGKRSEAQYRAITEEMRRNSQLGNR
ncbi:lytic transglycosylase domain-containing protein [Burkholderia sp. Ax-1719]|uniref:lytic transglycosylase domain-containing protein n=1 Tax=Burkholderia sp. Ax-1719 TaxID=2608334 RepID=UPI00141DA508|nr:lytic transglycosylase domain-containing protein [Burkholderia sp. Ax-1719]NIE67479.1 lytic transglycosylase domain-containing protein [Burkholderia sp. Ax-1719]